ncbi:hypothetical protein HK096_008751, partial [Nowakowskiella sp. JEL0078]
MDGLVGLDEEWQQPMSGLVGDAEWSESEDQVEHSSVEHFPYVNFNTGEESDFLETIASNDEQSNLMLPSVSSNEDLKIPFDVVSAVKRKLRSSDIEIELKSIEKQSSKRITRRSLQGNGNDVNNEIMKPLTSKRTLRPRKNQFDEKGVRLYCLCSKPDVGKFMIACDFCKE